ncbi:hypothetical protein AVEN_3358-1 [Araneus ventricosus]|uniref:Uncharacterized protein n=1 Tax=Araneus ventricosus TaxID=182803 RepID=A0A4Y2FQ08_ARAVE|nr:hypothetical protein AVEN_3358-1 [Araneus ventricosus]
MVLIPYGLAYLAKSISQGLIIWGGVEFDIICWPKRPWSSNVYRPDLAPIYEGRLSSWRTFKGSWSTFVFRLEKNIQQPASPIAGSNWLLKRTLVYQFLNKTAA